jgi:hypothetical protein
MAYVVLSTTLNDPSLRSSPVKKQFNTVILSLSGALLLTLLLSVLLFVLSGESDTRERVLYFPLYRSAEFEGEVRELPKKDSREADLKLLVEEIILGPFNIHHDPLLPEEADVRSVLLRDETLYVDFSIDVIFQREGSILSLNEVLEGIRKTVTFNFPFVERIVFTVRGEVPESESGKGRQSS